MTSVNDSKVQQLLLAYWYWNSTVRPQRDARNIGTATATHQLLDYAAVPQSDATINPAQDALLSKYAESN